MHYCYEIHSKYDSKWHLGIIKIGEYLNITIYKSVWLISSNVAWFPARRYNSGIFMVIAWGTLLNIFILLLMALKCYKGILSPTLCLWICLYHCLSVYKSVWLIAFEAVYLYVFLTVCLSVSMLHWLYLSLSILLSVL